MRIRPQEIIICTLCKKEASVEKKNFYGKRNRFCSRECSQEYVSKNYGALYKSN